MNVAIYRVVDRDGWTVAQYPVGRTADSARLRAIQHATRIGGNVFHIDEHGYLALIFKTE